MMTINEVAKLMAAGIPVFVGPLVEWEATDTEKFGAQEHYRVLCGKRVLSFSRFNPNKSQKAAQMTPPEWVKMGVVCAFIKASIGVEGKYLRTDFSSVEPIKF